MIDAPPTNITPRDGESDDCPRQDTATIAEMQPSAEERLMPLPAPPPASQWRESKEATHRQFYEAFCDWFKNDGGCDFWSECDAPEALATISVELCDKLHGLASAQTRATSDVNPETMDSPAEGQRGESLPAGYVKYTGTHSSGETYRAPPAAGYDGEDWPHPKTAPQPPADLVERARVVLAECFGHYEAEAEITASGPLQHRGMRASGIASRIAAALAAAQNEATRSERERAAQECAEHAHRHRQVGDGTTAAVLDSVAAAIRTPNTAAQTEGGG